MYCGVGPAKVYLDRTDPLNDGCQALKRRQIKISTNFYFCA
jgi:hypothetical protein